MKKAIAGSVLAVGALATLFNAGTAQAAPGVSVSVNGQTNGIGDQSATGATASSAKGNAAVAVSLIGPANASANSGTGNVAASLLGGDARVVGPNPVNNRAVAIGGGAIVGAHDDVDEDGNPTVEDAIDVNVISVASKVETSGGQDGSTNTLAFCGGTVAAQSDRVTISKTGQGPC